MKPPPNTELFETPISTHWFDENGILCAVSKEVERTVEHYEKVMDVYKKNIKRYEKLCLMAELGTPKPMSKEVRLFLLSEMPKYIKAHAIITPTALSPTQANTFLMLGMSGFPVKVFPNQAEAVEWLKEYL